MRCDKCDTHARHKTVDITHYMKRQRGTLRSHVADLTAQRTAAEEKCRVLEALPPTEDTYKDLLLQTRVKHLVMREDVSRNEVVYEEELARNFLTQALSREGEVCALKSFVAKAGRMIAKCEAVCQLGDDQVLRAVTESQAVVRSINSMAAASGDRHLRSFKISSFRGKGRRGGPKMWSFSKDRRWSDDALAQRSALAVQVSVNDAIAKLRALGEKTLTAERFEDVTHQRSDPKLACLLLRAGAATKIPDDFFTQRHVTCIDISYAPALVVIGDKFLCRCTSLSSLDLSGLQGVRSIGKSFLGGCTSLSTVNLSGLRGVTSIGNWFLSGCTSLSTVDLRGLQGVSSIGKGFLFGCTSLSTVDLSPLQRVTSINSQFLKRCTSLSTVDLSGLQGVTDIESSFLECKALKTLHGKDTCSKAVLRSLPKHLRNCPYG